MHVICSSKCHTSFLHVAIAIKLYWWAAGWELQNSVLECEGLIRLWGMEFSMELCIANISAESYSAVSYYNSL